ncbi:RNA polymerase sigma-70 factor [Rhodobacteraceae bacterium KLH11]|nr:RNA polymerase sigma-70 factor [Rhodobacteraceae bacterium KLH11]
MEDLTSHPDKMRGGGDTVPEPSDEMLLGRFADGDATAARLLTERLGPRSYSVALRMLGNRAEAEDVTQEAMMRLWKMAPDWVSGQAQLSTWLYRVTLNLCVDLRRRKRPDALENVAEPADGAASVVDRMQDAARKDALQAALDQLPDRQRQAVVLRHIEELSNPEIAGIMDISVEAVESLTARGKRALAAILAGRRDELGYEHG